MATNQNDLNLRNLYWSLQNNPDGLQEMRVVARTSADAPINVIVDNPSPIPVTLGSNSITITGNVNVGTTVKVDSTPEDPVHTHVTEIGTSGNLQVPYMPVGGIISVNQESCPWLVIGNVNVSNMPTVTVGNFPATQKITGNINVSVLPAVTVSNFPNTQAIVGNVNISSPNTFPINLIQVNNLSHSVTNPVFVEQTALYYPTSFYNTMAVQLAPGASWVGTIETILSLQAAQIEMVSDQPYTVYIYQYMDAAGTQLTSTDTFTRGANQPLNENVTLPGNYFNIKVTNNGNATTTNLAVNTTFGIMSTQPRTNTNLGNYKTSIEEVGGVATNGTVPVRGNVNAVVSGTVTVSQGTTPWIIGNVNVSALPSVTVGNWPASQQVVGNVNVTNTPTVALQSNAVTVTNNVTVNTHAVTQGSIPWIIGNVNVSSMPGISVNFPAQQPIIGNVNVSNTPTVTLSSNAVTVSGTVTTNQGAAPWTVVGNVNAYITNSEIEIKNDLNNPIPISANTSPNTSDNPIYVRGTGDASFFAPTQSDAFGRLRVSEPYTLGDYKHIYGIDPNFIDYTTNGGAVTFQANQASARLSTSSNSASRAVHQSKFYHHYMPGKSQVMLGSFNFYAATTNVTKRTGYFDDNNGIFFEQTGNGTLNIVLRSYTNGSVGETRIPQSQWNIDTCNASITGTTVGAANYGKAGSWTMDITKTQLLFIDFEWLGVGRVRVGFVNNGGFVEAHEFSGSNNLAVVYMSTPNLPVRCEILNTGTTTGAYFDQICSTVMSEGGYVEAGTDWAMLGPSARTVSSGATLPVLAIRLKNTFQSYTNRMIVRLGETSVFSDSGNTQFSIVKLASNANITGGGGTWTSTNSNSGVEYLADATGITGGDVLNVGFSASAANGGNKAGSGFSAVPPSAAKKNYIVQNYDSTSSEIYAVVVKNIDSKSTDVTVGLQWREIY
jgi:hypothetical protein